ncbi:MAG: single-stranded DNA-binding protein [Elusimicrobiota bacterium]
MELKLLQLNRVMLSGRLVRDPELKYTTAGTALCKFTVATGRRYKDKEGNWQEQTTFVPTTVWDKQAQFVGETLKKGSPVYVEGSLRTNKWVTKDGQNRSTLELQAVLVRSMAKSESEPAEPVDVSEPLPEDSGSEEVNDTGSDKDNKGKVPF